MEAAGYQFFHIATYGLSAAKKRSKNGTDSRLTVREVIAEAAREIGACPHVAKAQPPTLLYGPAWQELEAEVNDIHNRSVDAIGRRMRRDATVLLGGIASYPRDGSSYQAWRQATLTWLQREFGKEHLRTVVEHLDEAHPHLHFYVVNPNGGNVKTIHPGFVAAKSAQTPKEQHRAYTTAMRQLQDRFWEEVSAPLGMARIGPARRRLTRAQWSQEQYLHATLAPIHQRAKAIINGTDQRDRELKAFAARTLAEAESVMRQLDAREAHLNAMEARLLEPPSLSLDGT
jgi:hypothetical protein